MLSEEQKGIIEHRSKDHGRVLAGPGTGKSTTVLHLAEALSSDDCSVKLITFTRAATAELSDKALEDGRLVSPPTTVHSFALSLLLRNPGSSGLPEPLRIPDEWESDELIRTDIGGRLRAEGFPKAIDRRQVEKLESEMAAGWESLDPNLILDSTRDPRLRNRYVSIWSAHRSVFGYSLFAEMPLYARQIVEDRKDADIGDLQFLVVDEYQDLNRCEIALLEALAEREVRILAVGDDDQSIFSFRMAHPIGIQEFQSHFNSARDYRLSVSFRCGRRILDVSRALIETAPRRGGRPSVVEGPSNPDGTFDYLSFADQVEERRGIVTIIKHLMEDHDLRASDVLVLSRADYNSVWSEPLRAALADAQVPATDVEAAIAPLAEGPSRKVLAIARLAVNRRDDLAWWAYLRGTSGVSAVFIAALTDEASTRKQRFSDRVLVLETEPPNGVSSRSLRAATRAVAHVQAHLDRLALEAVPESEHGWFDWLLQTASELSIPVSERFKALAAAVGKATPQSEGLNHFLNQLEPLTKDFAVRTDGVAIMTMGRSKGLTFRATIVMGVEEGVVPFARARDQDEERRLLYVAMTRAREFLFLTMAQYRTDATARSGEFLERNRSRSPFFQPLNIRPQDATLRIRPPACCR